MSIPRALPHDPSSVPPRQRVTVHLAVFAARLLALLPPRRIRTALTWLRRGARPATYREAGEARQAVVATSLAAAGARSCVVRSLAVVLLCRGRGHWATWCVGPRALPPFSAHAWVEAQGKPVGEPYPPGYFLHLVTVGPGDTA
ncbi:lasso peptide biosynthesis B2 protein [Streptomyces sp. NPDC001719]